MDTMPVTIAKHQIQHFISANKCLSNAGEWLYVFVLFELFNIISHHQVKSSLK